MLRILNRPVPMWIAALLLAGSMSLAALAAVSIFTGSIVVPAAGSNTENQLSVSSLVATNGSKVLTSTVSGLSPTFTGLTLSGLTASLPICTTAGSALSSTCTGLITNADLANSSITVAGTSNQVNVSGCSPVSLGGTCTLSTPQSIGTGSSPTFLGLTLSGLSASLPVCTTAGEALSSTCTGLVTNADLANSSLTVAGTTNQVNVSGCGPVSLGGTCTLSLPQSINSGAAPTFAGTNFTVLPAGQFASASFTSGRCLQASSATAIGSAATACPVTNGTNTWSAIQNFTSAIDVTGGTAIPASGHTNYSTDGINTLFRTGSGGYYFEDSTGTNWFHATSGGILADTGLDITGLSATPSSGHLRLGVSGTDVILGIGDNTANIRLTSANGASNWASFNSTSATLIGSLAVNGGLSGVTTLAMGGALSGVTTLGMSGALSGGTTANFSGLGTFVGLTAGTGTVQGSSDGSHTSYVGPTYTASGAAVASTWHQVFGTTTATISGTCVAFTAGPCSSTGGNPTLSGAAAFTSATSYACSFGTLTGTAAILNLIIAINPNSTASAPLFDVYNESGTNLLNNQTVIIPFTCSGT